MKQVKVRNGIIFWSKNKYVSEADHNYDYNVFFFFLGNWFKSNLLVKYCIFFFSFFVFAFKYLIEKNLSWYSCRKRRFENQFSTNKMVRWTVILKPKSHFARIPCIHTSKLKKVKMNWRHKWIFFFFWVSKNFWVEFHEWAHKWT